MKNEKVRTMSRKGQYIGRKLEMEEITSRQGRLVGRWVCACIIISLIIMPYIAPAQQVVPVKWKSFKKMAISDPNALLEKQILLNTNRYALTIWYDSVKQYYTQTQTYLDFGGTGEHHIRAAACEAFALVVSMQTGIYDAKQTGVSFKQAKQQTRKLITSLAHHHKANTTGGWGDHWQSALWTAFAGGAGWLLWNDLPSQDQLSVQRMVEYEANRFNNYEVPYYKNRNGQFVRGADDSKMEENSWNAMVLQLAMAMMPQHANYNTWMNKNIELLLSSLARPEDVSSATVINGKALRHWLKGSNINSDGTVTNHGFIHPDYMSCTMQNFFNALLFALAGQPAPQAVLYNTDVVYKAIVDLPFSSPPYVAPGGTIYIPGSDSIYYPMNTDWGRSRRMCFALMDCQADAFKADSTASRKGAYWEALHARQVVHLQQRNADKRTYQDAKEDTYKGREEWVAMHAALAWLTKWLMLQDRFRFTNRLY